MARIKAKVNPDLLAWAREDAGFSLEEAAARLRLPIDLIEAWEEGLQRPTLAQMRRAAEMYKRPLALFYMKERPTGFLVARDFRKLPGKDEEARSPELRMEMRRANERRRVALELVDELDRRVRKFTLECSLNDAPEEVGRGIRDTLGITFDDQSQWREPRVALREWRRRCERVGVLVFQAASFAPSVARGFSIVEEVLPVVVINRKDALAARIFTLLHELTHVLLRQGGICDLHEAVGRTSDEERIEVFCNAVAGSALVPAEDLLAQGVVTAHNPTRVEWEDVEIEALAASFACSRETVLRRLLTFRRTSAAFYEKKRAAYERERSQALERKAKVKKPMKRNVPAETVSTFGRPFLTLALDTYYQQRITLNDLSEMLGVKSRHIAAIEKRLAGRAA